MHRLIRPRTLITLAALFALFFPSSIGGVLSPTLDRLAIGFNVLAIGAMLLAGCIGTSVQVAMGTLLMGWLLTVTLFSGSNRFSMGVALVFAGLAMLYMLDVRSVRGGTPARRTMVFINVFAIVVGLGLSLNIDIANRLIKSFYSSFYPELLISMIDWHHKPVLTFATHSTAGFFMYLFFYLNFRRFQSTGSVVALGVTLAILILGFNLRSRTSTVLMAIASVQVTWEFLRRWPCKGVAAALALILAAGLLVWKASSPAASLASVTRLIQGEKSGGFRGRFSEEGTLGGNLRYLRDHPFSPIGLTYGPPSLFYGDSGIVMVLLRGSVPLLVLTYSGFAYLLSRNLRKRRDAVWLFGITCAFEVAYTPLQLFRFTAFLPFLMVYLNDLPDRDHAVPSARDGASGTSARDKAQDRRSRPTSRGANQRTGSAASGSRDNTVEDGC